VNETTFAWDFGDGATSAEENPVHNYTVGGVYDINLTVTDAQGTDNELKVGYITVGYDAAFTASPTEGESPTGGLFHGSVGGCTDELVVELW